MSIADPEKGHIALGSALELAEMALKEGNGGHKDALVWVERAEGLKEDYPRCLYLRGLISCERGDLKGALESLKKLMNCQTPDLLLPLDMTMLKTTGAALMGKIYLKTDRPQEAVAIIERAQQILKKLP